MDDQTSRLMVSQYTLQAIGKKQFVAQSGFRATLDALRRHFGMLPYSKKENALNRKLGVLLVGPTGTGKSRIMQIMQRYCTSIKHRQFDIHNTTMVLEQVKKGASILEWVNERRTDPNKPPRGLCIDELGQEVPINNYGTKEDPVLQILQLRANRGLETHATSNLTLAELSERYGERVASRLQELFNVIECNWQDFRELNQQGHGS